jgi:hypothetical protein
MFSINGRSSGIFAHMENFFLNWADLTFPKIFSIIFIEKENQKEQEKK